MKRCSGIGGNKYIEVVWSYEEKEEFMRKVYVSETFISLFSLPSSHLLVMLVPTGCSLQCVW